ncbi:MAG: sigma 54-interacting transcriptional regulator [Candidatus Dependentiae bacterium]|nr:sigma 54-interacting transcriptional regulator [Candidatus Dependentiae bacterium]
MIFFPQTGPYEFWLYRTFYLFCMLNSLYALALGFYAQAKLALPALLRYHIKLVTLVYLLPHTIFKLLTYNPLTGVSFFGAYSFLVTLSGFALTIAFYYCAFRLAGLRFLNTRSNITASRRFNFVGLMKDVWFQFNSIVHPAEFRHVTQQVFGTAFQLPEKSVRLIILQDENYLVSDAQRSCLQHYLAPEQPLAKLLADTKVMTRDEIDFSAYYDQNPAYAQGAEFLRKFGADVFLPIYDQNTILGCILVSEGARPKKFYSSREQDEMVVFAASLSAIITLIRNRNIDYLLAKNHSYTTELYRSNQEILHYQESIRSFARTAHEHQIGLLYYKINVFTFGNKEAYDLVTWDPNLQRGHPLGAQLRKVAANCEKYGSAQHATICLDEERRLSVSAFPSLERQSTIVLVSRPDIADILKMQSDLLRDQNQWNYVLYLETTVAGRQVAGLFPGGGSSLFNFKIDLLRAAFSQRAVLLDVAADDRGQLVDLLHETGQRTELHSIMLKQPEKDHAVARQLFGFADVFGVQEGAEPLLSRLDKVGTLYIENVQYLSHETQQHLAEFLRLGAFTRLRDKKRVAVDVRVICTAPGPFHALVDEGLLLPELLDQLYGHALVLPQPALLEREEFGDVVQGYMSHLLKNHALRKILSLTDREVQLLYSEKCQSFAELKRRLGALITAKAAKHDQAITAAQGLESATPRGKKIVAAKKVESAEIAAELYADERIGQAALLGKKALRNPELLQYLWDTFHSQAKIATLLGVNRSSVNRRFKALNIGQ